MKSECFFEKKGGIGIITMDNPPLNVLSPHVIGSLETIISDVEKDDSISVIIFRSNLEKYFCSGADLKNKKNISHEEFIEATDQLRNIFGRIIRLDKISIAEINGTALGGGFELALHCDLRFMSEEGARVGLPEVNLGLLPGTGGTQLLQRLIGSSNALLMISLGEIIEAGEALNRGIVNRIFPRDEISAGTMRIAEALSGKAKTALKAIKKSIYKGKEAGLQDALMIEKRIFDEIIFTENAEEGINAFLEKRKPHFT